MDEVRAFLKSCLDNAETDALRVKMARVIDAFETGVKASRVDAYAEGLADGYRLGARRDG